MDALCTYCAIIGDEILAGRCHSRNRTFVLYGYFQQMFCTGFGGSIYIKVVAYQVQEIIISNKIGSTQHCITITAGFVLRNEMDLRIVVHHIAVGIDISWLNHNTYFFDAGLAGFTDQNFKYRFTNTVSVNQCLQRQITLIRTCSSNECFFYLHRFIFLDQRIKIKE